MTFFKPSETLDDEVWIMYPEQSEYLISNLGRVYSTKSKKLLSLVMSNRYMSFTAWGPNRTRRQVIVHKEVMRLFKGPRPSGLVINHIDGDRTNNKLNNLEYITQQENMAHAARTGLLSGEAHRGHKNGNSKLTDRVVLSIVDEIMSGSLIEELSTKYHVHRDTISLILKRKTWTHLNIPTYLWKSYIINKRCGLWNDKQRKFDLICKLRDGGNSIVDISKITGIPMASVHKIWYSFTDEPFRRVK